MMSPRRWILLLIFYISYLMFGASIYYHIEHNLEKERRAEQLQERIEINEYLVDQLDTKNETAQNVVLEKITAYCGKPVTNYTTDQFEDPYTWTFYHAFFFSFTVLSTVGYGNLAPTTTLGRMIMIIYSLIGIPINGILFSGLGDYFSKTFTSIYSRYKKYKMSNDIRYVPPQLGLFATVCIALVPGITFFIVLPSLIFSYFESWSFLTSVYYSYVTMTTIGFGDFVPTFQPQQPREFGGLFVVYQIFIIVWFIFSLGYLVMIMTFISKGLRSKKLARLEYQLSENIKSTQNRIWNGVTKDVGYLRRILNELYIMKFKPVYNEPFYFTENRSISCPDLTMYRVDPPVISRKRAFSECYDAMDPRLGGTPPFRTSSDTELSNINKQKTFETAETFRQTTDLLAQVVTALASIRPPEEELTLGSSGMHGGYHGFTDSQILASEWSYSGMDAIPQRERAFSDFNLNPRTSLHPSANEWTWSGDNNQIQQAINIRSKNRRARDDHYKSTFPSPLEGVVVDMEQDDVATSKQRRKFSMADGGKQFFRKLIPFKKRSSQGLIEKSGAADRKFSIVSVPEVPDRFHAPQDYYSTINVGHLDGKKPLPGNIQNMFVNGGPGAAALANRRNTMFDAASRQEFHSRNALPIFPPPASGLRKRRESLFTQNPNMRRGSMFPGGGPSSYRRGSLFTDALPRNVSRGGASRRPSMFSVTDENANQEILENTTIADIIRALEAVHTQAVLQQPIEDNSNDKKKRKLGTAGLAPPSLPPIFTIFNTDDQPSTSGNRLFSRRSTIVGATANLPTSGSILTRRRPSAAPVDLNDPPPIYSEKETPKFRRRFSVRPTNLQIPPGMAPPPQTMSSGLLSIPSTSSTSNSQSATQTALQRRLSLRPSPLARETIDGTASRGSGRTVAASNTSSTHSPLSRIVQISQAQRKNSEQKDSK